MNVKTAAGHIARSRPRVLSIAGTDPSGGAGQSADVKTIGALGGYAMSVLTSIVPQNTQGVTAIHVLDPRVLAEQFAAVFDDANSGASAVDAIKIGLVPDAASADVVAEYLPLAGPGVPRVLDPVLVATSGHRLGPAVEILTELARQADIITPNVPELAALTGHEISCREEALNAAAALAESTGAVVLAKGGHLDCGDEAVDALVGRPEQLGLTGGSELASGSGLADGPEAASGLAHVKRAGLAEQPAPAAQPAQPKVTSLGALAVVEFSGPRLVTRNTHGTGCTLSSALATLRGRGMSWPQALGLAKPWMARAISAGAALGVGATDDSGRLLGHGPLDHFWHVD
ncbi:MAG: PfkB family carbohydrate kinase [Actinomycetaceae bacterium]|nr:PfkB family carbohydrate kinase [Actinomycetaceae bacterium]